MALKMRTSGLGRSSSDAEGRRPQDHAGEGVVVLRAVDVGVGDQELGERAGFRLGEGIGPGAALLPLWAPLDREVAVVVQPPEGRRDLDVAAVEVLDRPFGVDEVVVAAGLVRAALDQEAIVLAETFQGPCGS